MKIKTMIYKKTSFKNRKKVDLKMKCYYQTKINLFNFQEFVSTN